MFLLIQLILPPKTFSEKIHRWLSTRNVEFLEWHLLLFYEGQYFQYKYKAQKSDLFENKIYDYQKYCSSLLDSSHYQSFKCLQKYWISSRNFLLHMLVIINATLSGIIVLLYIVLLVHECLNQNIKSFYYYIRTLPKRWQKFCMS